MPSRVIQQASVGDHIFLSMIKVVFISYEFNFGLGKLTEDALTL